MGASKKAFGNPLKLSGRAVSADATAVPLGFVDRTKLRPAATTYTSTTFVLNGTSANPIIFWISGDYFKLEETLTYTWTAAANTILDSSGVVQTAQSAVAGAWYFYVGITDAGAYVIYPSQTAPNESSLNHPGTSKARDYAYVGYQVCSAATTPAFVAMTKIGYRLNFAAFTVATATTWAELAFTGAKALPKHGALGATVGGHVNAGAAGTIVVGSTSGNTLGVVKGGDPTATGDQFMPLPPMSPTANGKIYAQHTTAAGDVNITFIDDIV